LGLAHDRSGHGTEVSRQRIGERLLGGKAYDGAIE
jgi:hypothetical protein